MRDVENILNTGKSQKHVFHSFLFQGIRGPVGSPGPVGLKGEQVHTVKIVILLSLMFGRWNYYSI